MVDEIINMRGNTRLKNFFYFFKKMKMQYKKKIIMGYNSYSHLYICLLIIYIISIFYVVVK